jgi:hypothetical protein
MADSINLYQKNESSKSAYRSPFDGALAIILFFLVVVCAGYGALSFYILSIQKETNSLNEQIAQKKEAFRTQEESLLKTNDVYLRLEALKTSNKDIPQTMSHLSFMEKVMIPEVALKEYSREEFTQDSFQVTLFSNFLDGSSKQLTAFRESGQFSGIQVLSMNLEEEGFETVVQLSLQTSNAGTMEMNTGEENL